MSLLLVYPFLSYVLLIISLIKNSETLSLQNRFHYFLVRLLSSAKSRLAGAGFEPRRFAAGFRLRLNLPTCFESCPKTKKKLAVAYQVLYHSILVRLAGFEPAAYGLEVRCSIQLSYRRIYSWTNYHIFSWLSIINV